MSLSEEYEIKIVEDLPSQVDKFGGHKKVASAIASTILENSGGKSISLEGAWGSGKSSIIEMLKDDLNSRGRNKEFALFTFDSWMHEKDPLRRAFLEEIIDFFIEKNWLTKKEKWLKKKEYISKKRKVTENTVVPKVTWEGKILGILTILVPVGLVLFNVAWNEGEVVNYCIMWSGAVISVLPLVATIIIGIVKFLKSGTAFFDIFLSETEERTLSESFETPDPTSIEFEKYYNELIEEGVRGNKNLVIVIDNLDRIDPNTALTIWSTMRVFFDAAKKSAKERIWLVVPFDRDHLVNTWNESGDSGTLDSFLEKTFQITYRVSPPILSSWKDYLFSSLNDCFPNYPKKDDFHTIYRIVHHDKSESNKIITPRFILKFTNKLGALNRQWRTEIPIGVQALFCLKGDLFFVNKERFNPLKILSEEAISENYINILGVEKDELANYFTSLYFNLDKGRAAQVLLEQPIESSIENCNKEEIEKIHNLEGFWDVLETVVENSINDWFSTKADNVTNLSVLLSELNEKDKSSYLMNKNKIWDTLLRWPSAGIGWAAYEENVPKGLDSILERASEDSNRSAISRAVIDSIKNPKLFQVKDKIDSGKVSNWFKTTLAVFQVVQNNSDGTAIGDFKFQGSTEEFLVGMGSLFKRMHENEEQIKCFLHPGENSKFIQDLVSELTRTDAGYDISTSLEVVLNSRGEIDVTPIFNHINTKITASHNLPHLEVANYMSSLFVLVNMNQKSGTVSVNHLYHYFHYLYSNPDFKNSASTSKGFLYFLASENNIPQIGNVKNVGNHNFQGGVNTLKAILSNPENSDAMLANIPEILLDRKIVDKFVVLLIDKGYFLLLNYFFHLTYKNKEILKQMPVDTFLTVYKSLEDNISEFDEAQVEAGEAEEWDSPLNFIVLELFENSDLVQKCIEAEFSDMNYGLYTNLVNIDGANPDLFNYLKNNLALIKEDVWGASLRNEDKLFVLLDTVKDTNYNLNLEQSFFNAISEFLKDILSGLDHDFTYLDINSWSEILDVLDPSYKATLTANMRDLVASNEIGEGTFLLFKLLKHVFEDEKVFDDSKLDDLFRKLSAQIGNDVYHEKVLAMLEQLATFCDIGTHVKKEHIKSFSKSIKSYIKNDDELEIEAFKSNYPNISEFLL